MKWLNPSVYLLGALLTLGPAGVRIAMRSDPAPLPIDQDSVAAGKMLFEHNFQAQDPLCPNGDGLGPVFNATSCVACHHQGGIGGSGGRDHNVTNFVKRERTAERNDQGVVHSDATDPQFRERLNDVNGALPGVVPTFEIVQQFSKNERGVSVSLSQRNTPALFGAKLIDEVPDRVIIAMERVQRVRDGWTAPGNEHRTAGRALRLPNGQIGKFGWKAQSASLTDFVQAACANELGLGNPGADQPTPLTQMGRAYQAPGLDLTAEQCRQITTFVAALDRPRETAPATREMRLAAHEGKQLFHKVGCADCHTPSMGSIEGLYSDLLLHRMGLELEGVGSYNGPVPPPDSPGDSPKPDEWRTPPLWGVADSGPWMHDGRANTLEDAIRMHGGQGSRAAQHFQGLSQAQQAQLIGFLKTLRAPQ